MTHEAGGVPTEEQEAADRIEEARQLIRSTSQTVSAILADLQNGQVKDLQLTSKLVVQLTTALTDLKKREAEFDERFKSQLPYGHIDFDELRHNIGCRLARIRECCREGDVSEGSS